MGMSSFAQTPDFSCYGYASMAGGTTGGQGGPTVTPSTIEELLDYAADDQPRIILIDKEFKGPNVIRLGSNKTLLGIEDKAFINQIGVSIQSKHNIIIQNIKFTMTGVPISNDGENKIQGFNFDPDCIAIQADDDNLPENERKSHHIWIDHCEFYNEDPKTMTDYDRYDGLVDMKNDVQYVTISWNYFHDHHKACLNGKGNSDNYERKTTMHHNKFENIKSRMPLLRYGELHLLNNYMYNCPDGNGLNVRVQSNSYVEKNYFDNVKKPIFGKLSEGGRAHLVDNRFIDCGRLPSAHMTSDSPDADPLSDSEEFEDSDYTPPYLYSSICKPVNEVPAYVNQYVGIGIIEYEVVETYDCAGVLNGTASYDACNVCSGGNTGKEPNESCTDCNGDINGTATIDDCNVCSGGNTGIIPNMCNTNLDCHGDEDGTAYIDDCGVCVAGNTGNEACSGIIQAETACAVDGVLLETDNAGYLGDGYVNTDNELGVSVNWVLNSVSNQTSAISFRFANGGGASRDGEVFINGISAGILYLPSTNEWSSWETTTLNLDFGQGSNEIEIKAITSDGLANIDALFLNKGIEDANCSIVLNNAASIDLDISVSPNPVMDILYINKTVDWNLETTTGKTIRSGFGQEVVFSDLEAGLYLLKIQKTVYKILKN